MCRFNISFNDAVIDEMRPLFADEKALLMWMQAKMEQLMKEYAAQFKPQLKSSTDGAALLNYSLCQTRQKVSCSWEAS